MTKSSSKSKKVIFFITMMAIVIAVPLVFAEIFLRFFHPQAMMWPRLQFSPKYSVKMPPDTVMVNDMPGEWRFTFTEVKEPEIVTCRFLKKRCRCSGTTAC